ncbi:PqqD family protein [Paenibacillus thalictri]|nr:PqqD family protein [Paenibacillus thalictri]
MNKLYRQTKDVEGIEVGGEWIIMHVKNRTLTKLNGAGGTIWSLLHTQKSVSELTVELSKQLNYRHIIDETDVQTVLGELLQIGIIESFFEKQVNSY